MYEWLLGIYYIRRLYLLANMCLNMIKTFIYTWYIYNSFMVIYIGNIWKKI